MTTLFLTRIAYYDKNLNKLKFEFIGKFSYLQSMTANRMLLKICRVRNFHNLDCSKKLYNKNISVNCSSLCDKLLDKQKLF